MARRLGLGLGFEFEQPTAAGGGGGAAATHIIVLHTDDNIYIVDKTDATSQTVLTTPVNDSNVGRQPIFLPNEQQIIYPEFNDWYVINLDDTGRTRVWDVSVDGSTNASNGAYDAVNDVIYIHATNGIWSANGNFGTLGRDPWAFSGTGTSVGWKDTHIDPVNEKIIHTHDNGRIYSRLLTDAADTFTATNNYEACACDPDGGYVFGLRLDGQIDRFVWNDLAEATTPLTIVVTTAALGTGGGRNGGEMVYDPDGNHLYVQQRSDGHLYRFDATGNDGQTSGTDLGLSSPATGFGPKGICLAAITP